MAKTANFLAADLGASNGRLLLAKFDGKRFDLDVLHRFPNGVVNVMGTWQWDVLRLWTELLAGLGKYAQQEGKSLTGVGVDTWGVDFGLLDRQGKLLGNPVGYRDARTDGMVDRMLEIVPKRAVFELVGTHFIQFNSLIQLFAMRTLDDPLLDYADTFLMMPDLMNYWLTGVKAVEYTDASTSMMLHARERRWVIELLHRLNLPTKILPPLVQPGERLGTLRSAVAEETGLDPATPLLTVGSHDTASAVAAVPGLDERSLFVSSGTWSLTGAELDEPVLTDLAMQYGFTNEGGVGGKIRFLQNFTGLWLLQACQQQWLREGKEYTWRYLEESAKRATPFKCHVNPDAHDFFAPGNMVNTIRAYAQKTGQPEPEDVGEMVRCCLESLALNCRWGVEVVERVVGRNEPGSPGHYETIRVVGGGSQNRLLNQWCADATGREVVTGPVEATALGNVMMQAIATGHLKDIAEGRQAVAASVEQERFAPGKEAGWDEAYERFKGLKV
jgi:rhamnulokinase